MQEGDLARASRATSFASWARGYSADTKGPMSYPVLPFVSAFFAATSMVAGVLLPFCVVPPHHRHRLKHIVKLKGAHCNRVVQGQLHDGLEVAVKRCFELPSSRNQMDFQDLEFQNEICSLGKLQHINVVKLLGYCIQGTERILVYEYMLNRSVDTFIFGMCKNKKVASGLVYTLSDNSWDS
uniref:Serine-threonine/tyrosine-protein kinase catalytic domain-containing protein n=1 Tax=Oryza rufipogon TaxID=4529 RepID=A0A0E0NBL6_ORYRU